MSELFTEIERPTLLLNEATARRNIQHMSGKAAESSVRFRPHFKTHQSASIGEWFREVGVEAITVSSVDMAGYFAGHGWSDITVAFPANLRQLEALNELAGRIRLNLLLESAETAEILGRKLRYESAAWLKIDTGYGRTGIPWSDVRTLREVSAAVERTRSLDLIGLLTHAGHTYGAGSTSTIAGIFAETIERLGQARDVLAKAGRQIELSVGDTPGCSIVSRFPVVDEVRPGNFVFYDLSQLFFGACTEGDLAVAVACPVVAKHSARNQLVIYGGAVHLSKEAVLDAKGRSIYGGVALPTDGGWSKMFTSSAVTSLSQEHGVVQCEPELFDRIQVGDLLMIIPVHSCLTANLLGRYLTLDGDWLEMARL